MDNLKSIFKGYGKFDGTEDSAFQRKTRRQYITYGIAFVVVVTLASVIGVLAHNRSYNSHGTTPSSTPELTPAASLKSVCSVTSYPDACFSSISKIPSSNTTTDPVTLFNLSLKVAVDELNSVSDLPKKLANSTSNERIKSALRVCEHMIDNAVYCLEETVAVMDAKKNNTIDSKMVGYLRSWLSAAIADYETCYDDISVDPTTSQNLKSAMRNTSEFTSNSIAIATVVLSALTDFKIPVHNSDAPPSWVSPKARRLLQAKNVKPNVTVAADGSGNVKTVNEAVAKVPNNGTTMFVIYVKKGAYVENVFMDKNKWNVMMYGDGMANTIISGSRSNATGYQTSDTSTFAIEGKNFIMKDIGIINTAGPAGNQAVAFRSKSETSIYYRCSFDGYQDTLYTHANRQFYRECDVTGTVDFIFGHAAVVFQNCTIRPRQPGPHQSNTITAQGGEDPRVNSATSIQRCRIFPNGYVTAPTYLGRPWKNYSTTVVMYSDIGSMVRPEGWLAWDTKPHIYIGEYKNTGPGANLTGRVDWDRYKPVMSDAEAEWYTVGKFLRGNDWIPATGVQYEAT